MPDPDPLPLPSPDGGVVVGAAEVAGAVVAAEVAGLAGEGCADGVAGAEAGGPPTPVFALSAGPVGSSFDQGPFTPQMTAPAATTATAAPARDQRRAGEAGGFAAGGTGVARPP